MIFYGHFLDIEIKGRAPCKGEGVKLDMGYTKLNIRFPMSWWIQYDQHIHALVWSEDRDLIDVFVIGRLGNAVGVENMSETDMSQ